MANFQADKWFAAASTGDIATIRSMIVAGIDIERRDDQDRTAFHIASQNADTDLMTTLLAARKMNFLRSIGDDPFAAPQQIQENEGKDSSLLRATRYR